MKIKNRKKFGVKNKLVVVGDLVVDFMISLPTLPILPKVNQEAYFIRQEPGGLNNVIIVAQRMGVDVTALGFVGSDMFGSFIKESLDKEDVNTDYMVFAPNSTTTTIIVLKDSNAQHTFISSYGIGPRQYFPKNWREIIQGTDGIFFSEYSLDEPRLRNAVLDTIKFGKENGAQIFFDAGPKIKNLDKLILLKAFEMTDVLFFTEEEMTLTGFSSTKELLDLGPKIIILKRGGLGSILFTKNHEIKTPGFKVLVKNTVGAGDSFDAAFISQFLSGEKIEDVLKFANAAGAVKVQKDGSGAELPTIEEIKNQLKL